MGQIKQRHSDGGGWLWRMAAAGAKPLRAIMRCGSRCQRHRRDTQPLTSQYRAPNQPLLAVAHPYH